MNDPMVSIKKIILLFVFMILIFFVIRSITPFAPDVGTPGFLKPDIPEPINNTPVVIPPGGLMPTSLIVTEAWEKKIFSNRVLDLPRGFRVEIFASGLDNARFMAFDMMGNLYVTQTKKGTISVITDLDSDGVGDEVIIYASGLDQPHGIAFKNGWLYIAENSEIKRFRDLDGDLVADEFEAIYADLPEGGIHFTRTIGFGPDNKMYVSVGSSCNVCEDDPHRAVILRFDDNGDFEKVFAKGLRNTVGFVWNEKSGKMWGTDNGRDLLGDDLPPDEINLIEEDRDYGWPFCYGQNLVDPKYKELDNCEKTVPPFVELQAHSAPLGLRFKAGNNFPSRYNETLFVAYHGSWNRREPTGYKIVVVHFSENEAVVEDFLTGWLLKDGEKWGRPVDVIFGYDGAMYVSDDFTGSIYRIYYEEDFK